MELELLTDIDILLIEEKGIREFICHAAHRYASGNNKYMKEYEKAKNHHILCICMQITYIKCRAHNNFKTSIKLWIDTKKVHKVVQFSQKV